MKIDYDLGALILETYSPTKEPLNGIKLATTVEVKTWFSSIFSDITESDVSTALIKNGFCFKMIFDEGESIGYRWLLKPNNQ